MQQLLTEAFGPEMVNFSSSTFEEALLQCVAENKPLFLYIHTADLVCLPLPLCLHVSSLLHMSSFSALGTCRPALQPFMQLTWCVSPCITLRACIIKKILHDRVVPCLLDCPNMVRAIPCWGQKSQKTRYYTILKDLLDDACTKSYTRHGQIQQLDVWRRRCSNALLRTSCFQFAIMQPT
jgi:hypothetical protein